MTPGAIDAVAGCAPIADPAAARTDADRDGERDPGADRDPGLGLLVSHLDRSAEPVAVVLDCGPPGASVVRHRNRAFAAVVGDPPGAARASAIGALAAAGAERVLASLVRAADRDGSALRVVPTRLGDGRVRPLAWRLARVGRTESGILVRTLTLEPAPGGDPGRPSPRGAAADRPAIGRLAAIIEPLPIMTAIVAASGPVLAANGALRTWLGDRDPAGAGPEALVGRSGAARLAGALGATRRDETACLEIALDRHPSGTGSPPFQVRVRVAPLGGPAADAADERPAIVVIDDTSLQARTMARLQRVLTRFGEIERATAAGHWWLDLLSGESAWSAGLHRLVGRRPPVAADNAGGLLDAVHPQDRDGFAEAVRATARDGVLRDLALRLVTGGGAVRDVLACVSGERDDGGRTIRVFGAVQDVTRLRTIERELRAAKERAEAADRAKSRFLASASHDLRQPLQAALLFHAALAKRGEASDDARLIDRIGESLGALQEMMAAMLDVSRLDAAALEPDLRRVPLGALLAGVADGFAEGAARAGLRLTAMPTRLAIDADPAFVERILRNLVGNAVRHSGGRRVLIGARRRGATVALQVWDDGRGIPEGERDAVFGEFYQLDHAGRDARQGMGLGLAIVDRLAKLLGGRAAVRSVPGRRTVFEVVLPRTARTARPPASGGAIALPRPSPEAPGPGLALPDAVRVRTVAVIDDEPAVVDALSLCLAHRGHRVVSATTVDMLLDRLAGAEPPDAIVADYRLGDGITGDAVISRVREVLGRPIPAALLTGDTSLRRGEGPDASVAHRVLHKPIRAADLLAFVEGEGPAAP